MANLRNNVTLTGRRELAELLTELPNRVKRKGLRAAVTAASSPVLRAARAKAPKVSGLLKKAMGKKVKAYKGAATAIVGARKDVSAAAAGIARKALAKGDRRTANLTLRKVPANYLHLVEGGTRAHQVGKRRHPGARSNPFLTLAYHQTKASAEGIAANKLREVVEGEARKLGKL